MNRCKTLCTIIIFVVIWLTESLANEKNTITADELMSTIDSVKIVDFRGKDAHELDGFIPQSLLIPDVIDKVTENRIR